MALYTSVQSGPFDVASTWDLNAVPGDADQFNISYGHAVTVSGDIRPSGGFDNGNIYGKLHIQGSGCYLRMNGSLVVRNDNNYGQAFVEGENSGGYFRMDPGSVLEVRGTNDDQHAAPYIYSANDRYMTCEVIGTPPGPVTTLSAAADHHDTSLSFTDASKFRAGDYITVYKPYREGKNWVNNRSDEAFWIHDINSNTVYFRHFVSPTATITAVRNNKIVVDDASVFRKGQKIIFGTGNNRNVGTINDIGYGNNTIVFSSNVSGSVVGETIYQTGIEKQHLSGDDVKRLAATLTADSAAGDNTITVNNVNGFKVGDLILIPNNDTDYNNASGWSYIQDYTISAINTNTNVITITGGYYNPEQTTLQYDVKAGLGGLVVNMSRDTKIKPPDGATNQNSFVYANQNGNDNEYYRRWKFKDVEINLGPNNKSQYYTCVGLHGHGAYQITSHSGYVNEFDGNVIYPSNRSISYDGMYMFRGHQFVLRNNVLYNHGRYPIYKNSCNHFAVYNNIFCRNGSILYWNGTQESHQEASYNYWIRNGNSLAIYYAYGINMQIYSNYSIFVPTYPFYVHYGADLTNITKCYFDYYKYWPIFYYGANLRFNNCWVGNRWDASYDGGAISKYASDYVDMIDNTHMKADKHFSLHREEYLNANFKKDYSITTTHGAWKTWDADEKAWKVFADKYNGDPGFMNHIYVPDNTQVFISVDVKARSSSTSNFPKLRAQCMGHLGRGYHLRPDNVDAVYTSENDASTITQYTGFRDEVQATTASRTGYETLTLTIPAFPFAYNLAVGLICNNPGTGYGYRGWYEKDIQINMDKPAGIVGHSHNLFSKRKPGIANTATPRKTVWGGG